jgi:glycerophosphoryl diester phosphodiesterase
VFGDGTPRPALVGHRGAAALAPANTIAGFRAALSAGVDAIEFDVRRGPREHMVLAHGRWRARRAGTVALDDALAFFAADEHPAVGLVVDVKEAGTEAAIASAMRAAGLTGRAVACARDVGTLRRLAEADVALRRAWSLKHPRHADAARLGQARGDVPASAAAALRGGLAHAVTVHHELVTAALVEAVRGAGGDVFAWDVARLEDGRRLANLGVDALIVDDPRPFRAAEISRRRVE